MLVKYSSALENSQPREHDSRRKTGPSKGGGQWSQSLNGFILDGFLYMHRLYGQRRDNDEEECAFCNELLLRE